MVYDRPTLAISEGKKCGLIFCKAFHAEFAGPGSAVGDPMEQDAEQVIAVGCPSLLPIQSTAQLHLAYKHRLHWMRWLQRIVDYADPFLRVERLLTSFEAFFGLDVVVGLPDSVLAALVGVLPQTVELFKLEHYGCASTRKATSVLKWQAIRERAIACEYERLEGIICPTSKNPYPQSSRRHLYSLQEGESREDYQSHLSGKAKPQVSTYPQGVENLSSYYHSA